MKSIAVDHFLKWLSLDAPICICEVNGNIIYTGRCGDAPLWTFSPRKLVAIELGTPDGDCCHPVGTTHDIMITVTERWTK